MRKINRGDLILIKYKICPIGWCIRKCTHSNWNHIGVALNNRGIIDLRATHMRITEISHFMNKNLYEIKIIRIPHLTREMNEKIIMNIYEMSKQSYWSMLAKFILMYFGIISDLHINCAEIIAQPLKLHGYNICPEKDIRSVTPEDFNCSPLVEVIYG